MSDSPQARCQWSDPFECLDSLPSSDVPPYVRVIIDALVETKRLLTEISKRNEEVIEENRKLRKENDMLKLRIEELMLTKNNHDVSHSQLPVSLELKDNFTSDPDHKRSLVIRGVPESCFSSAFDRINHDFDCVYSILDFLDVECFPKTVYRMGRPNDNRPRLLKVVLPTSRFQRLVLKRKSKLRSFSHKGVYIRPSLPPGERNFIKDRRLGND